MIHEVFLKSVNKDKQPNRKKRLKDITGISQNSEN